MNHPIQDNYEDISKYSYSDWRTPRDFPDYLVHFSGAVVDTQAGREVSQPISEGCHVVNLRTRKTQSGITTRRVANLVAELFAEREDPRFDTVVFLDGNRRHHHIRNLCWRPRAYAIRYHKDLLDQFYFASINKVVDDRDHVYANIVEAAMQNGICLSEVRASIISGRPEGLFGITFFDVMLMKDQIMEARSYER